MEVAGGAIAVLSLSLQLGQSVQNIHCFWSSFTDAPLEVRRIQEDLSLLKFLLESIAEFYQSHPIVIVSSHSAATRSLDLCRLKVQKLASIVDALQAGLNGNRRQRCWAMFKTALRKNVIAETVEHLEGAKTTLLIVNQCLFQSVLDVLLRYRFGTDINSQIQYDKISLVNDTLSTLAKLSKGRQGFLGQECRAPKELAPEDNSALATISSQTIMRRPSQGIRARACIQVDQTGYSSWSFGGLLYKVAIFRCHLRRSPHNGMDVPDDEPIECQKTIILILPYLRRGLAISTSSINGLWSHTLKFASVVPSDSLVFELCRDGDLEEMKRLFRKGLASPFDTTRKGWTLLHIAARRAYTDICRFLLDSGVDAAAVVASGSNRGDTPLLSMANTSFDSDDSSTNKLVDTIRLLVQDGQSDPMTKDSKGKTFLHKWGGPAAPYHWTLHQEQFVVDIEDRDCEGDTILLAQSFSYLAFPKGLLSTLLTYGANPSGSSHLNKKGATPLHYAILRGSWLYPELFNANDNECPDCRMMFQCATNLIPFVQGACTERCCRRFTTWGSHHFHMYSIYNAHICPFTERCREVWISEVKMLIKAGVDVHAQSHSGVTPLLTLLHYHSCQQRKLWLKALADLNFNMHQYAREEQRLLSGGLFSPPFADALINAERFYKFAPRFWYGQEPNEFKVWVEWVYDWEANFEEDSYTLAEFYASATKEVVDDKQQVVLLDESTTEHVVIVEQESTQLDEEEKQRAEEISKVLVGVIFRCLRAKAAIVNFVRCRGWFYALPLSVALFSVIIFVLSS